jgi:hypothetical protein
MSTVPNAFGVGLGSPMSAMALSAINLPFGQFIKPGGRVAAYVRSTGRQDLDDAHISDNLVQSINAGCKRCRSGQNDVVVVLPGHTESLATADAIPDLVAGTQIVGVGRPGASNNPTLTWTATASTFLLNVADVGLIGLNLNFAGIDNVAAPITVSAAGCSVLGCQIQLQSATASAGCVQGIALASGADDFIGALNVMLSDDEGEPQSGGGCFAVGAAVDNCVLADNYILAATPGDTVGLIDVTAAATNIRVMRNVLIQIETTNALNALIVDNVAASGCIVSNMVKIAEANDVTPRGMSIGAGAAAVMLVAENYVIDNLVSASAILQPPADTIT